jgi:hypothetical protein
VFPVQNPRMRAMYVCLSVRGSRDSRQEHGLKEEMAIAAGKKGPAARLGF